MSHGVISNEVLLAKIESAYGTDPTPTAGSNALLMRNFSPVPFEKLRMHDRQAVRASLGTLRHIYGGSLGACRFDCEIKGSGAAGTPPEIGALLRACGLGETIVGSTSVTYAPVSTALESVTIYAFEFGRVRHILSGCRGNVSFMFRAGEPPMASFELIGKRGTVSDQSQPSPTISTVVPIAVKGLSAQVGGVSNLVIQEYELNLNNSIEAPDNVNDSEGYGNVCIIKRDPTLSLLMHSELVATINPVADLIAGTARAFAPGGLGSAGNIVTLACAQMHYRSVDLGEAQGFRNRRVVFGAHESSTADTDFSLAFT